jgi:tRNA A37 methylthiotransferase MiaB
VKDESKADFIILNTCGFINWFEESSERVAKYFLNLKKKTKLIVIGCMVKINRDKIAKYNEVIIVEDLKDLDKYFFTIEKFQHSNIFFNNKIYEYLNSGVKVRKHKYLNIYLSFINNIAQFSTRLQRSPFPFNKIAERHNGKGNFFVKIGEGCAGNCSYCVIKKAKNRIISRPVEEILLDIKNHIDRQQEKSVVLVADDCGSYGIDIGTNFIELLYQIGNRFPSIGIGIYYLYPKWIEKYGKELLDVFQKVKIDNINIPIQSGSQKVLELMNRKYNLEKIFQFINLLKKISPKTLVHTHFLIGFPGARFKDFLKTLSTIHYFHYFQAFTYSNRKDTKSSELTETVSDFMKKIEMNIAVVLLFVKFIGFFVGNVFKMKKHHRSELNNEIQSFHNYSG